MKKKQLRPGQWRRCAGETDISMGMVLRWRKHFAEKGYELPPLRPPWQRRARNFLQALSKHAYDLFRRCSQAQIDERLAICQACEYYVDEGCVKCGCKVSSRKSQLISKLAWRSSECPEKKWPVLVYPGKPKDG